MIHQTITIWMRAIRIRFMLASVIAVARGRISIAFWKHGVFNLTYSALTFAGVICLHASVDLLNDYWDYKRRDPTSSLRGQSLAVERGYCRV